MLPPPVPKQKNWLKTNWKWFTIFLLGLFVFCTILFIRFFIIHLYKISSGAMQPTLVTGDRILVDKTYSNKDMKRGDIIVFKYPKNPELTYVSRIIGMPGELFEIKQKTVFINQAALTEEYIMKDYPGSSAFATSLSNYGPVIIPDDSVFVLGDNRDNSLDSRVWGFLACRLIKAKATMIYWSWDESGNGIRSDRIGKKVK